MKLNKIALRNSSIAFIITISFVACDKDFASVDSDIINDDTATNFNTTSEKFDVISYNKPLNPIQTNNLGLNMLGVYDDPTYGRTVASLLTQVNTSLLDPSFGDNVILDSVVLTIPFFSRNVGVIDETFIDYEIDSVLPRGESYNPIKLSIFENTYFLRDFNPNDDFDSDQAYFSNKSASITEQIGALDLESVLIDEIESLTISNQEIILTDGADTDAVITERLSPRIRLVWDKDVAEDDAVISYWTNKIIAQEGLSTLSNPNNFNDYFRGLYFKAEPESMSDNGSLMLLNLSQQESNITLYYSFDSPTQESERDQSTYLLTFSPTRVNFFENDFTEHPDLFQGISVFLAHLGTTGLYSGLETLKIKETDRIEAMKSELLKFNVFLSAAPMQFSKKSNTHYYTQEGEAKGERMTTIKTYDDHRMALSFAILAMKFPIIIENPKVVSKSYPNYWKDLEELGFEISTIET